MLSSQFLVKRNTLDSLFVFLTLCKHDYSLELQSRRICVFPESQNSLIPAPANTVTSSYHHFFALRLEVWLPFCGASLIPVNFVTDSHLRLLLSL